jgi:hypothetical protein
MMRNRPSTIPPGLRVELTRHRIIPGQGAKVDEWMEMLNDRADECRVTLDAERMAVEVIFRLDDEHGEWLYGFEVAGEQGAALTGERAIDRDHIAYAKQAKEPGHVAATPGRRACPHGRELSCGARHADDDLASARPSARTASTTKEPSCGTPTPASCGGPPGSPLIASWPGERRPGAIPAEAVTRRPTQRRLPC